MEQIIKLYEVILQRRHELEASVNDIRNLFRPWPQKLKSEEEKDSFEEHERTDEKNETLPNSEPVLSPEEQQSVNIVDQLLRKAQKAIDVQKKLEEPKRPKQRSVHNKLEKSVVNHQQQQQQLQQYDNTSKNTGSALQKISKSEKNGEVPKISNGTVSKQLSSATKPSSYQSRVKPNDANERKSSACKSAIRVGANRVGASSASSVERPRSGTSQKRVAAAHVTAPFQTNARLASAKMQTTYRASTVQGIRGRGKYSSHASHIRASSSVKSSKFETQSELSSAGEEMNSRVDGNDKELISQDTNNGNEKVNNEQRFSKMKNSSKEEKICDLRSNCDKNIMELEQKVESLEISDNKSLSESDITSHDKQQQFVLARDGHNLKIPAPLRKHVFQNRKLREKLLTEHLTTKVNSPQTKETFLNTLQQQFSDVTTLYTQHHAKQAQYILASLSDLSSMFNSLHLESVSVETSALDILRARKLLEFILLQFYSTEEKVRDIDFSILTTDNLYRGPCQTIAISKPDVHSTNFWYKPTSFQGGSSQRCYKYNKPSQLDRHTQLVYDIQLKQLQLDVMEAMYQHVIPLLHSLQPTSSEFIQVLRMAYSMLSTNPCKVPVVVKDTIQDDDEDCV